MVWLRLWAVLIISAIVFGALWFFKKGSSFPQPAVQINQSSCELQVWKLEGELHYLFANRLPSDWLQYDELVAKNLEDNEISEIEMTLLLGRNCSRDLPSKMREAYQIEQLTDNILGHSVGGSQLVASSPNGDLVFLVRR